MWHKDRYQVQLITSIALRFTPPGETRHRQVSAYQKSFRPSEGTIHQPRPKKDNLSAETTDLFAAMLRRCRRKGPAGFTCDQPWSLWRAMLPEYKDRASAVLRRGDNLSLGEYTLGDFKIFYAALMAVCAVHDYLCFLWQQKVGAYPYDAAVIVHSDAAWADILATLSGVAPEKCRVMINELTLGATNWSDVHIHPFVPLDETGFELALAPHFPLHSNIDENILRICSTLKPTTFDMATLDKEAGMRDAIKNMCPQFSCYGPVKLTKPTPHIDMIVADEAGGSIAIIELKWIRKPFGSFERIQRDQDVLKGFGQLGKIRLFLDADPLYLNKYRGLPRRLDAYEHVYYLVVARYHWPWAEPEDGIAILDFAPFSSAMRRSDTLHAAITELLTYSWLPVEGRDFNVVFESHTANGVFIEGKTFYPRVAAKK